MLRQRRALACALVILGLAAGAASADTAPGQFTDPGGDSAGAPDITGMTFRTTAAGQVTIRVGVVLPSDAETILSVYIDTDNNPSTGAPDPELLGADYVLDDFHKEHAWDAERWDSGSAKWVDVTNERDTNVVVDDTGVTFTLPGSELQNATKVNVFAVSLLIDSNGDVVQTNGKDAIDWAPDTSGYSVDLSPLSLHPAFAKQSAAKAGATFTMSFAATRSDSGAYVTGTDGGTDSCVAKLGGKPLAAASQGFLTSGSVPSGVCTFRLAKTARGKPLVVTMTITEDGATATHTVKTTVR